MIFPNEFFQLHRRADDDRATRILAQSVNPLASRQETAQGHGRDVMIIRPDGLGGVLFSPESKDGGRTWPEYASITRVPNPGSKATLYPLGGDTVAMLHNPNSKHRSPLALWIRFDSMKTWPYQRALYQENCDGPHGRINYPDGFVSQDKQWLHFAFDDNLHRTVHAKLPPLQ